MKNISRYFQKHNIESEHILSAYCHGRILVICLDSGNQISCTMQMHELMEVLPENEFVTVRRGTIVRKSGILAIGDDGVYN